MLGKGNKILHKVDDLNLNNKPRKRDPFGRPRMRNRGNFVNLTQNIKGLGNIPKALKTKFFRNGYWFEY